MNKTTWESTVKPVVVLSVISLVVSLLLAVVNSMTAPVIAENERATTLAAYVDVMPSVSDASTLEEVSDYTTAFSLANAAKDVGICMNLANECGLDMPGEANVKKVYDKGMEAGMGGDDWRSTFKLVRGH